MRALRGEAFSIAGLNFRNVTSCATQDWNPPAALKEIKQLENKAVWVECKKEEANGEQIVPCTWVFRYNRNPAGEILKCEARICLRGDLMIDDSDSYAPVVAWSTI